MNNLVYSVGGWDGNQRLGTIEVNLQIIERDLLKKVIY